MTPDRLRDWIGVWLILAFISTLTILFWKAIPPSNEQLIVYMMGQLSGFVAMVMTFHYVQKSGEKELEKQRVDNTSKALDAITETAKAAQTGTGVSDPDTIRAGDEIRVEKADT